MDERRERPLRSAGTRFDRREQFSWPLDGLRILSIDGGGIRGILPAKVLALCEEEFTSGRPAGEFFDYIAGTSTGGIIALGLSIGMSAKDVLRLYVDNGATIFPPRLNLEWLIAQSIQNAWHFCRDLTRYKYDRKALEECLNQAFDDRRLGEVERRLVIPSFDEFNEVTLFKTPHHPDYGNDWKYSLVQIALSTAAAPTFFSTYKNGDRQFADGGVWANNPIMTALVDALACYQVDRHVISILSLGCVEWEFAFTKGQISRGGVWHWKEIISSAMRLQSQNALGQAGLLVGRERILRLDGPSMKTDPIALDDYDRSVSELPPIAELIVDENYERLKAFFTESRPAFKAYHGPRAG